MSRSIAPLALILATALTACGGRARLPVAAGTGPAPELPAPSTSLIPTVDVAKAVRWQPGERPTAASGLAVTAFASGLDHPRWLYVLPNGDVLVAETNAPPQPDDNKGIKGWFRKRLMKKAGGAVPSANRITLLRDTNGDGVAETRSVFLSGQRSPFGMVLVNGMLYVANTDAVDRFEYSDGATRITGAGARVVSLPAGPINHHWTKSLTASRDGARLYVGVGSNSNAGERGIDKESERAAIWEIDRATGAHRIYASGLRNPVGLAFEPESDRLWTAVNERDELGGDLVPDYLTHVEDGGFYGFPYSYFGAHVDTRVEPERPDLVARAIVPDYALGPHTASLGLAFARGNAASLMPAAMRNGAFIGQHGSWNRTPRSGYKVVFVPFSGGKPSGAPVDVLTGFLGDEGNARGRPVGVAMDGRGALLVADDVGNTVWRVTSVAAGAKAAESESALALPTSAPVPDVQAEPEPQRLSHASPAIAPVPQPPRAPLCFRGQPLPKCRAFFLAEVTYNWRVAGTSYVSRQTNVQQQVYDLRIMDLDSHLSWDVGYMANRDAQHAVGGTVMIGTGDAGVRLGAKGRYRRWSAGGIGTVDLSLGVISAGVRSAERIGPTRGVGLTGDVTLGVGDYAGITARADVVRAGGRNTAALFGGARLGSLPGVIASALGGIGLVVLIIAISKGNF